MIHPGVRMDCRVKPAMTNQRPLARGRGQVPSQHNVSYFPSAALRIAAVSVSQTLGVGVLKTGEKYAKFNIAAVNGLKYLRIK